MVDSMVIEIEVKRVCDVFASCVVFAQRRREVIHGFLDQLLR